MPSPSKISPVARGEWSRTFETFINMNRGRKIKIERYGGGKPHEHMVEGSPLFSLTYDPPDKGDSLVIAVGKDRVEHEYPVAAPQEVFVQSAAQEKGSLAVPGSDEGFV